MSSNVAYRLRIVGTALLAVLVACTAGSFDVVAAPSRSITVQILAVNDFHGNLEPPAGSSGRIGTTDAGGVEFLATHLRRLRSTNPNTVFVSTGDLIGASPLISALFRDEPTIEVFNRMNLDLNSVGNHEFDQGVRELERMQRGGCHPVEGCRQGERFAGADFAFLAGNVLRESTGRPLFNAFRVVNFRGIRIAFIGVVLEETPQIVTPAGVAGLTFEDEADTVNALIPALKRRGADAIVVMLHQGGSQSGGINECQNLAGPVVDIVDRLDPAVDVVLTAHTHQAYTCEIDGRLVTQGGSFGRLITKIDLTFDRFTRQLTTKEAENIIVTRDVPRDRRVMALVDKYRALAAPLADRVIGSVTETLSRTPNAAGESALGDVIADAQWAATASPATGAAVVAFMNPGGIRADLTFPRSGSEGDGNVTYNEIFTVQPFGNSLVTMTLTGTEIDALLEQQFDNPSAGQNRILQVSSGFQYAWSTSAPTGNKVDIAAITLNGTPIDPNATYRVTVNSFLATGGDRFSVLAEGTERLGGPQDLAALETYIAANSPVAPGPQNRITTLP